MSRNPKIAIIGAGIGGLALAGALSSRGFWVTVYEQAHQFKRLGAGIQQSPNAVKVLRKLGVQRDLRIKGFVPADFTHRAADTGEITNRIPLGRRAEETYGAPYLLLHRGDLHDMLLSTVPPEAIHLGKRLVGLHQVGDAIDLTFADGTLAHADIVIGADGVHSAVREMFFGPHELRFSGRVGYRATIPAASLGAMPLDGNTKWWGPDRHLIVYYTTAARDEVYVMGTVTEPDFGLESWSSKGDVKVFCRKFAEFHPAVRRLLGYIHEVHKWALVDHAPLPSWSDKNIVLIGDAAHPMMPHMGQGAAMTIEDVAVLLRCIDKAGPGNCEDAFGWFEAARKERTSKMQSMSAGNMFMRTGTDPVDWVYSYDAWSVAIPKSP